MSTDIELYPRDQTDFSHHGYALDDISNDIVTWQLNAKFTLTFDYPMLANTLETSWLKISCACQFRGARLLFESRK